MKLFVRFFFVSLFVFSSYSVLLAQPAQGNVIIVQRLESAFSTDGSVAEFDSLTNLFNTKVWNKNPLVISHKTIRHWWGHDNRDIIEIAEVASWEDVVKVFEKNIELFNAAWSTQEARDAFNDAYDKYFTGQHSDEIYREIK